MFSAALLIVTACDVCDSVGGPGWGSSRFPFARPNCSAPDTLISADAWPRAGDVRRDRFRRDCVEVDFERRFVPAVDGFGPDELFSLTQANSTRNGVPFRQVRQTEFIGKTGPFSYRYSFSFSPTGGIERASATLETVPVTSRLIVAALTAGVRPAASVLRNIDCEEDGACELWESVEGDVVRRFYAIEFDKSRPGGDLCLEVPSVAEGEPRPTVSLSGDGTTIVEGLTAKPSEAVACLGSRSSEALRMIAAAKVMTYTVVRQGGRGDAVELKTEGFAEAVSLATFLSKRISARNPTPSQIAQLEAAAERLGGAGR